MTRSLPGGRAINVVEVTEYEPDRLLTVESRTGPTPFRYAYILDAVEEGTALTLHGRISAEGLLGSAGHLGDVLAERLLAQGIERNLLTLKHLLEAEAPHRSSSF